jgi:hypothetical protein
MQDMLVKALTGRFVSCCIDLARDLHHWSLLLISCVHRLEHIPKSILNCRAVSREINFTSMETIERFRCVDVNALYRVSY